jgi:hypothetical protein
MIMGLLSACGGEPAADQSGSETEAGETSFGDAALAFAQCMRENGIDMPDPQIDGDQVINRLDDEVDPESDAFQRAQETCSPLMEGAVQDRMGDLSPEERERMQQQLLDLAACVREKGFDMPDPTVDGGGIRIQRGPAGPDPDEPGFDEAIEQCREESGLDGPMQRSGEGGQ